MRSDREAKLEIELKQSRMEVKLLREKVDALVRMLYGSKSEKLDINQLTLLGDEPSPKEDAPVDEPETGLKRKRAARKKREKSRLPEHLPVEEVIIDPDEVMASPEDWRCMGEEVSEQLDYRPGKFLKRRLVRRKYVRKDHPFLAPVVAPLPSVLQERCLATPELIAQVVVSKYVDHLPLYRQEQIYRSRYGVYIPRQTLCRWVELAARELELVYEQMKQEQLQSKYLQMDETPIRYLSSGKGKCAQGYFWVSSIPYGDVIYHWQTGRGADCVNQILDKNFKGTLQCDGYKAYTSFQKQRAGPIELAGCWAHVRRKFFQAKERHPKIIRWILSQIGQLYQIEKRLREENASAALRERVRSSESAMIICRIQKALLILKPRYLPQSDSGKAIRYAMGQWKHLDAFLKNGSLEIDNNLIENAIRPTKLGAKNWMFIGSEGSGKTSAILYSLIESAKRHGLEPHAYMVELLNKIPTATNWQIPSLTPKAIAKAKRSKVA